MITDCFEILDKMMTKLCVTNMLKKLWTPTRLLVETLSIYMLWITIHYVAAYEYYDWCVPKNFKEYMFYSQVMVNGIHCNSLRWIYVFSFENSKINLVSVSNIALKCLRVFTYTKEKET